MLEPQVAQGMDEEEQAIADLIYAAMQNYSLNSERGLQAQEFRVGVSDLGYCSERTRRMLDQQVPDDTDMLQAFIGTAIGDHVEKAMVVQEANFEGVITQAEISVTLTGEERVYEVTGHPDIVLPTKGVMLDAKTAFGLALARRVGADQQKRFQRHLYGLGAWEAGLFGDIPLDDVRVGNVWIDRSGVEKEVHVELEPYDPTVREEAARWLDSVIYAFINGEEAMKEPPREVCAATCGFFTVCRAYDTDVSGLLTDETVLTAIEMYREGGQMERDGKRLKAQAKPALEGISGTTGEVSVRWIHVNESVIPETTRRPYDRIDIRKMR